MEVFLLEHHREHHAHPAHTTNERGHKNKLTPIGSSVTAFLTQRFPPHESILHPSPWDFWLGGLGCLVSLFSQPLFTHHALRPDPCFQGS